MAAGAEGRYKLVLKKDGETAPTKQEVLDGAGVYRQLTTADKAVLLAYDISSGIKAKINAVGTSTTELFTGSAVDAYLLSDGTTYKLYGAKADDSTKVGSPANNPEYRSL